MILADLWQSLVQLWEKLIHTSIEEWVKVLMPFIKVAAFFACFFSVIALVTLIYGLVENWLEGLALKKEEREQEEEPYYDVPDKD